MTTNGGGSDAAPIVSQETYGLAARRCAAIFLREVSPPPPEFQGQLRRFFDLTPKEAAVATALAQGSPLKEIASQQGITYSTARTYLVRILQKTETHQQSQLVALLKDLRPPG